MAEPPTRPPAQDDVAAWDALLAEALQQTGGPISSDERAWADEALGIGKESGRPDDA